MPVVHLHLQRHHFSPHARRELPPHDPRSSTVDMTMTVLGLVFFALLLATCLVLLRRIQLRRARFMASQESVEYLPSYQDLHHDKGLVGCRNARGLTIHTTDALGRATHCALVFGRDGQPMLANPNSPPHSPDNVPAIHITFPDEECESGGKKGGRVVVVRVGDSGVGLEPLRDDEPLPAYEKETKAGFYSVDMDRIGGLKEKPKSHFDYN